MKTTLATAFFLITSFCLLQACKKSRVTLSEEPACKLFPQDTSFTVALPIGPENDQRFFDADTVFSSWNPLHFTANDTTADEYVWKFSGDPRTYTGRQIKLAFTKEEEAVYITLTQKRKPTNPCAGSRPLEQVFTRRVTVVEPNKTPILGQFYGYNASNPTVKFTVEILNNGLRNLPLMPGGTYDYFNEIDYAPNAIYIKGLGTYDPPFGAYSTSGFGFLKNNNTAIQINYSYRIPSSVYTRVTDTFYGIKKF
ncbi:MAG TPA: hypothetical protein VD794_04885 [Flavisolibacter sp.]|nr:hypothetical protein [Flavisolibacter sp.]